MTSPRHSSTPWHLLFVAATLLLAASCHSLKNIPEQPSVSDTSSQNIPQPSDNAEKIPREKSIITFTATVDGINVNGQLRIATDSVIWITVNKFVELGRALATTDSVWVNVPLANKYFKGTYSDVSKRINRQVNYQTLQQIIESDDPERQIEELAHQMGFNAKVRITRRQSVQRISFPFAKP